MVLFRPPGPPEVAGRRKGLVRGLAGHSSKKRATCQKVQTQGLLEPIIMGSTKIMKNADFHTSICCLFWALKRPPGPRDPQNPDPREQTRRTIRALPAPTTKTRFPDGFWFLTFGKQSSKTLPKKAPGASWARARAAPGPPPAPRTPPGPIRKVVPENA